MFNFLKVKEIRSREGELHFIRYRLLSTPWFSIFVHKIFKADKDKHLHDHPWSMAGVILSGKYWWKSYDAKENNKLIGVNKRGSFFFMPAQGRYHKIIAVLKPVTTLVVVGKRKHFWGYYVDGTFVDHKTYRKRKNKKNE